MKRILKILLVFLITLLRFSDISSEVTREHSSAFLSTFNVEMKNLPNDLPDSHKLALKRINEIRIAMDLPPWVYDAGLSSMGQAHADYVLLNCKAGRKIGGHYENPSYPGYTKEGDEAARTSGLSGGSDPLLGLERLLEGSFHRTQFFAPEPMRVGLGFTFDPQSYCGSTLFVNRPIDSDSDNRSKHQKSRYTIYPPDGFKDANTTFISEWPDPRPGFPKERSGTIASIHLNETQVNKLLSSHSEILENGEVSIPIWETNPANPTYKKPPPGMETVYSNAKGNPFAKNSNSVFIMPKNVLKDNMLYKVRSKLVYSDSEEMLEWTFTTRGNRLWKISPTTDTQKLDSLNFAMTHSIAGDQYNFQGGVYEYDKSQWFQKPTHFTASKKSVLQWKTNPKSENDYLFSFTGSGEFSLNNFVFQRNASTSADYGYIYLNSDTKLNIHNTVFRDNSKTAIQVANGAILNSYNSTYSNLGNEQNTAFCIRGRDKKLLPGVFGVGEGNEFSGIQARVSGCGAGVTKFDKIWVMDDRAKSNPEKYSLRTILNIIGDGEEIHFKKGDSKSKVYDFTGLNWLSGNFRMIGEDGIVFRSETAKSVFLLLPKTKLEIEGIRFEGNCSFFELNDDARLVLRRIQVATIDKQCYFGTAIGNAELIIENSDFREYNSQLFIYRHSSNSRINLGSDNLYPKDDPKFQKILGK